MKKDDLLPSIERYKWVNGRPVFHELPILILFWSISCQDCKALIRTLVKNRWDFLNNFDFFSVHMPRSPYDIDDEKLEAFCLQQQINFPVLKDHELQFSSKLQNQFVPSMYMFSANKQFIGRSYGNQPFAYLEKLYKKYSR